MEQPVNVTLEFTPNPNTLKFVVNRPLIEKGTASFTDRGQSMKAPLAQTLFEVPGVSGVLLGPGFVTITKAPSGDWDQIAESIPRLMESFLSSGALPLDKDWAPEKLSTDDSALALKIREILDKEIRPAVAMDGGDIVFQKVEAGVVYLHLQGSCRSCPSSVMTLKMGVETRLKEAIPEIKEVVQIQ